MSDIFDLVRELKAKMPPPFSEQYPELAETLKRAAEAERRALSGPTIVDLHQAQRERLIASAQMEISNITKKVHPIISDKKE